MKISEIFSLKQALYIYVTINKNEILKLSYF